MSYVLDVNTTDSYQYLSCPGTKLVTIQVTNALAAIGFGENPDAIRRLGGGVYPPTDEPFLPSVGGLSRECDEIRVKSYAVGVPANVKIVAR